MSIPLLSATGDELYHEPRGEARKERPCYENDEKHPSLFIALADYMRARSPERKQERMEAIMAAADGLFAERPYHQITMGAIAERLGWSRSNLYKYAATQEEVFLALHSAKNRAWIEELAAELAVAPMPADEFARTWAEATERHGGFLRYQEIIISIIESNVTLERLTAFKRDFAEMLPPVTDVLARQCGISEAAAGDLYLRLLYQAPGLWNHFHAAELTCEAMRAAGLPEATGGFVDAYADFVEMCITAFEDYPPEVTPAIPIRPYSMIG